VRALYEARLISFANRNARTGDRTPSRVAREDLQGEGREERLSRKRLLLREEPPFAQTFYSLSYDSVI